MIKGLIENECAGQNSLIKLGTHFTSGNVSEQQKLVQNLNIQQQEQQQQQQQSSGFTSENFVNEYLAANKRCIRAPRTFQMETLFNELKQIEPNFHIAKQQQQPLQNQVAPSSVTASTNNATSNTNTTAADNMSNEWSQSYWSSLPASFQKQQPSQYILDDRSFKWSADYLTQSEATIFDEAWEDFLMKNANAPQGTNPLASGLSTNNENLIATNQLNEEMRKTANELLDSMQDSRFSETEFLQFVRNLSVNALNTGEKNANAASKALATKTVTDSDNINKQTIAETDEQATIASPGNETTKDLEDNINFDVSDNDLANDWVREFENIEDKTADMNDYWNELQSQWNSVASENPDHPWLEEFQKVFDTYKTYEFDNENPLKTHPNPFEEGLQRLKMHDIVNAVLLFEAAVHKEPDNMLAWQYLGTTQVENEQDPQAIRALRKCLELKPDNLIALSTLATSYTNESMQRLAFDSLIKWIKHNPKYSNLLKNDDQAQRLLSESDLLNQSASSSPFFPATLSVVHARDFIDLQEIYLKAVRESVSLPNKIDPDLQCCLGVLFHLSNEYDKAADCFKTALQVKPDDHLLWNKLGATYANNNRNEEAIDAYYQALKLCPGFVRARYNLGIGCMNLGAYKEAVEHFLTALVQQSQACISEDSNNETDKLANTTKTTNLQQMSDTIWSTLRLALSYLNRTDLHAACLTKNLDQLKQEFKI